jgi:hypothetical protein
MLWPQAACIYIESITGGDCGIQSYPALRPPRGIVRVSRYGAVASPGGAGLAVASAGARRSRDGVRVGGRGGSGGVSYLAFIVCQPE